MPPDSIISDLKKFVSPECVAALEKAVEDAKTHMLSDWEKNMKKDADGKNKKKKGKDNKPNKPTLGDLKNVATKLIKKLLSVIDEHGGIKDVIYDSENRRVAWSSLQGMQFIQNINTYTEHTYQQQ